MSTRFSLGMEMSRLTWDGIAEPVSRDQILGREHGQGNNIHFPCSADHEQDWQPYYPVDPCSCNMCGHTYKHSPLKNSVLLHYFLGFHIRISPIAMQINFHFFHDPCYLRLKNIMGSSHIYIYTQYSKRKYSSTTDDAGYCHTFFHMCFVYKAWCFAGACPT